MESELFLSILRNRRGRKNQELVTYLYFKRKINVRGVFLSEQD